MVSNQHSPPSQAKRATFAWSLFAVLAALYLWTEHQAHLLGILPYLLLLACPLMHLFMHHGHHHHGEGGMPRKPDDDKEGPNER